MARLSRLRGLAMLDEATYNTDPTITEATDSVQTSELQVTPFDGEFINRNLDRAALGAQGDVPVAKRCIVDFNVECAGAGSAGGVPGYDEALRGCGFAATNTPATDQVYDPISTGFESMWLEANIDGDQHIASGAYGTLVIAMESRNIPQMQFSYMGLYNAPTAVSLPTYTLTEFQVPEAFNNANTVTATLGATNLALESMQITLNNQLEHIDVVGSERIEIVDRDVRGTLVIEAPAIGTKDWYADVIAQTYGALVIQHGDTAGNIFQINAPRVQIVNPTLTDSQGRVMLTMEIILIPDTAAGNDEIVITAK